MCSTVGISADLNDRHSGGSARLPET